jgi:hypothetical protein
MKLKSLAAGSIALFALSLPITALAATSSNSSAPKFSGQPSNARSAPSQGGSAGTVGSVSKSSFTMTTTAGAKVTVDEASSTTYKKGTSSTKASAIKKGEYVLALGITSGATSGTTIKATQVTVSPPGLSSKRSSAVVSFQRGKPSASKQVGQIPKNWVEGQGTIVTGTAATKGTEAALAAYPGTIVDRVVKLSDGEYDVHFIGVNWPHHVFLSKDFKVVGTL